MMPGLALGAALTPFGLGEWPLEVAGFAIGLMNRVAPWPRPRPTPSWWWPARRTWALPASLPGAAVGLPVEGAAALGGPAAGAGGPAGRPSRRPPDVWVSADGSAVAVRDGEDAVLLRPDVKLFGAELWARRRGLTPRRPRPRATPRFDCDHWSCGPGPGAPVRLAAAWNLKRPLKAGPAGGDLRRRRGGGPAQRLPARACPRRWC